MTILDEKKSSSGLARMTRLSEKLEMWTRKASLSDQTLAQVDAVFGQAPIEARKASDRRCQVRAAGRLAIRFYDPSNRLRTYRGVLTNNSDGGAFIETNESLPLLTKVEVEGPGFHYRAVICRVHWFSPEERARQIGGLAVRLTTASKARHQE